VACTLHHPALPIWQLTEHRACPPLQLYHIGGHDGDDDYLTQGLSLSLLANVTNNFSTMPAPRSHFAAGSPDNTSVIGVYHSTVYLKSWNCAMLLCPMHVPLM